MFLIHVCFVIWKLRFNHPSTFQKIAQKGGTLISMGADKPDHERDIEQTNKKNIVFNFKRR